LDENLKEQFLKERPHPLDTEVVLKKKHLNLTKLKAIFLFFMEF
jgi:hypothetical protein